MRRKLNAAIVLALLAAAPCRAFAAGVWPVISTNTPISFSHFQQLRSGIDSKRADFSLTPFTWTTPYAAGSPIRAGQLVELRTAVTALMTAYHPSCPATVPSPPVFTDPVITPGSTPVRAVHYLELKAALLSIGTCAACCAGAGCDGHGGCSGAGTCAGLPAGSQPAGCAGCRQCDGANNCAPTPSGTDCGTSGCRECNGAGTCTPKAAGSVCANSGGCQTCNGSGTCGTAIPDGWPCPSWSGMCNGLPICCSGTCQSLQCFVAGTKVMTPSGAVAIESLAPGDAVYSWDAVAQRLVKNRVAEIHQRRGTPVRVSFSGAGSVTVTPEHPFFDPKAGIYRPIGEFKTGDQALLFGAGQEKGVAAAFSSREDAGPEQTVYNLTVAGPYHNYIAGGLLVHNKQNVSCSVPCQ